jgi:type IV pilus assembly protein PilC
MKFEFRAKKMDGGEISGEKEAADEYELARELKKDGYILIDFKKTGEKFLDFSFLRFGFGGVSLGEKMVFTRNLAVMISAGLPITRALEVLMRQTKGKRFREIISGISSSIKKGRNLSDSLSDYKKVFSTLYVAMVKVGEKSGGLDKALRLVAQQLENDHNLRRKVKGAMVYPVIVIVAMLLIGVLMLIYVVPTLVSTFEELGVELPASTRFVIWLSRVLVDRPFVIIGGFLAVVLVLTLVFRSQKTKKRMSGLVLKLPLFGPLVKKLNSARTTRTLASLISAGVGIVESLAVTATVVQNESYKRILRLAGEEVKKGSSITTPFREAEKVYPPLVAEMIAVGEETGKLSEMLEKLAEYYEEEVAETTKNMATVIEPLLMILIGIFVGFFAISMFKPMYSMMGAL